jgi:transposase-like protein
MSRHTKPVTCPACGSEDFFVRRSKRNGLTKLRVWRCRSCGKYSKSRVQETFFVVGSKGYITEEPELASAVG